VVRDLVHLGQPTSPQWCCSARQAEWACGHGERRFVRLIDGRVLEFRDGIARG
jgi:hypothetical protein